MNENLLMEVIDAMNLVGGVHSKGNAIQAFVTNDTREALRMIWLASSSQNPLENGFLAD